MADKFEYIEGIHAVLEAINNNAPINKIYLGNYCKDNVISKKTKNYKLVNKQQLDQMSRTGNHQGVIAKVNPFKYANINDIKFDDNSLVVMLDHINDAGNLGAIIRSAEAVGAKAVIIPNKRAVQVNTTTYKTSAGAIFTIPIVQVSNLSQTIDKLKNCGFWIYAASEHTNDLLWDANLKGKTVLLLGSEHDGISKLLLKKSDFIVKLPILGKVESLNVAQAATACMYEWARQNA